MFTSSGETHQVGIVTDLGVHKVSQFWSNNHAVNTDVLSLKDNDTSAQYKTSSVSEPHNQ